MIKVDRIVEGARRGGEQCLADEARRSVINEENLVRQREESRARTELFEQKKLTAISRSNNPPTV